MMRVAGAAAGTLAAPWIAYIRCLARSRGKNILFTILCVPSTTTRCSWAKSNVSGPSFPFLPTSDVGFGIPPISMEVAISSQLMVTLETGLSIPLDLTSMSPILQRPKFDRFSLQKHLPAAVTFASEKLKMGNTILIFCSDGEDASVCVCLAILLSLYDQRGQFDGGDNFAKCGISKWNVRQCLVFVCKYVTNARPSRGGLRQVYNFLAKKTSV
eukprot:c21109_g1_i1 orf=148-789(-)